ncbi:hypothetical protein [Candidatus Laterigemmans baculatus]|uniref:hypothetical protein n=1 Tax=Candidatus Laterigemmans baculatus TaxID=2770505 RepID=UPI0013DAF270|nr:hypothetical protein [Candidatus Laterigemmans baculatus]
MKRVTTLIAGGLLCCGLVGCDVDVADEGRMPEVEVHEGEAPDVDVHGPEVTTGEKEVTVPTLDVDVPEENENEPAERVD